MHREAAELVQPPMTLETMSAISNGNAHSRLRSYLQLLGIDELVIHGHARLPDHILRAAVPPLQPRRAHVCSGRHLLGVREIACSPAVGKHQCPGFWDPLLAALTDPTRHRWVCRLRRQPSLFTIVWRPAAATVRVAGRFFAKIRPDVRLELQGSTLAADVAAPPDDGKTSMELPFHYAQEVLGGPLPVECDNRMLFEAMAGDGAAVHYCRTFPRP